MTDVSSSDQNTNEDIDNNDERNEKLSSQIDNNVNLESEYVYFSSNKC